MPGEYRDLAWRAHLDFYRTHIYGKSANSELIKLKNVI
jgi:hypothetical protein